MLLYIPTPPLFHRGRVTEGAVQEVFGVCLVWQDSRSVDSESFSLPLFILLVSLRQYNSYMSTVLFVDKKQKLFAFRMFKLYWFPPGHA